MALDTEDEDEDDVDDVRKRIPKTAAGAQTKKRKAAPLRRTTRSRKRTARSNPSYE